jgi:hypothetical protein
MGPVGGGTSHSCGIGNAWNCAYECLWLAKTNWRVAFRQIVLIHELRKDVKIYLCRV